MTDRPTGRSLLAAHARIKNPADARAFLRAARETEGLSIRAVAKRVGGSNAMVSHVETGFRCPSAAWLVAACKVYRVDPAPLLCAFRVVPDAAAERFFDVDRMRAALAGEVKRDEWLCGYAAVLGAMARHDASVRTAMVGDGITLAKLRAAGVEDFDMRDIERALAGCGR